MVFMVVEIASGFFALSRCKLRLLVFLPRCASRWIGSALLNTAMKQTYLLPTARNMKTKQTLKTQDLTGARFKLSQRALAQETAEQVAEKLSVRTGEVWEPVVIEYTPSVRRPRT